MLSRLLRFLFSVLVVLLALTALLLGSARLFTPSLGSYRNDVAALASHSLGRDVSINRMEATWRGLSPVIKLIGVRIASRNHPDQRLDFGEIWVRIDPVAALLSHRLQVAGIDFVDTAFTLVRARDGQVYLKEFPKEPTAVPPDLTVLSRLSLRHAGITYIDERNPQARLHFTSVSLVLRNAGDRHDVSALVHLPDELGRTLEFEAHLQGTAPDPLDWQGQLFLRGQNLQLGGVVPRLRPDAQPVSGQADIRLWAAVDDGTPVSLSGEVDVADFIVVSAPGNAKAALHARHLRAQFGWQRRVHGWQAVLQHFRMLADGQEWNMDNLSVAALTQDQSTVMHLMVSHLPLQEMRGLVAVAPGLDSKLRRQVLELQPVGELQNSDLLLRQLPDALVVDHFSTRFRGLGLSQSGRIPGIDGLSGSVHGSPAAGVLELGGADSNFTDARLFRAPLRFDYLKGELHWHGDADRLTFTSDDLHIENPHLVLNTRLQLELPRAAGSPVLHLQIAIPRASVSAVHEYLPVHLMSPVGVRWLDRSLLGGKVTDGAVVIDGPLDKLPFDHGEGRLEVRLPVTGATLGFDPHWSPVEDLDAQVDFTGRSMDIRSHKGRIRSAELHDVHAQILDLQHPHLTITGDVSGKLPVMMQELGSSPLGDTYGGFVDRVTTAGDAGLHLEIQVPLHKDDPISVAGRIRLQGDTLHVRDSDIALSSIRGQLAFDDHGITGKGLTARLFRHPVRARVWNEPKRKTTAIELSGRLGLIDRILPKNAPLRAAMHGNPDWKVLLKVRGTPGRKQRADLGLAIESTLDGVAIDLPPPLGKPAQGTRLLSLHIDDLVRDEREVFVDYQDALHAVLLLREDKSGQHLARGNVSFGTGQPRLPEQDVLLLSGELPHFRLEDWKPWLDSGAATPGLPLRIKAKIGDLELFGQHLRDTGVDLRSAGRLWVIRAAGKQLDGEIRLQRSAKGLERVRMNLQRLALQGSRGTAPETPSTMRPADFPDLRIESKTLLYNDVNFGALQLDTSRQPDGRQLIRKLTLNSPMLALNLTGEWYLQDNRTRTRVDVNVTGGSLGTLLDALGYEKIVKDGQMSGSLQSTWPGAPWDARLSRMDGKLSLVIKNGQLLDVEPGATGRALGLLSIGKLPRRLLALDFTDLFGKGFGFDRIHGDFILDSGNAWTDNLMVDGPAAKIEITGRAGLRAEDYDEVVTVTPYLNASLPIAGAIAGGPAGAAAAIVAEKLLQGKIGLNEMGRKRYSVTGSWADPVIKHLTASTQSGEAARERQNAGPSK